MTPQEYITQLEQQPTYVFLPRKLPKDMYVREVSIDDPKEEANVHFQLWLPKQKQPVVELKYILRTNAEEQNFGTKVTKKFHHYRRNGIVHSTTTPAFIITGKQQRWYSKGYLHREIGPAFISETKTLHRYQIENFPEGFAHSQNLFLNPTIPLKERIAYTKTLIQEDPTFLLTKDHLGIFPMNLDILNDTYQALLYDALGENKKLIPLTERILTTTNHLQEELYIIGEQVFEIDCKNIPANTLALMLTVWLKEEMK